ncbi:pentapeptide repeat-containing protein [Melittangium boletus]|uniref:Uncharacterized protein n=1 Tax=Melittangium boletus DSM 14713 TaxID=1294270 RepID=A0A250IMT4_9BACT|nr:pentapeptide repeat-containing protein [Melittangium boletus]ATB32560.1 hypothetical protein MEBOL_006048 [Melittangium boletus DSM 14713]
MARLKNVVFRDKEIRNERLELTDKGSLYFLSTNLTLRNCTVVLKVSAKNLIIKQAQFINCTFDVKQELVNHQEWIYAQLKGCRFKGRLSGCEFGHWPDYASDSGTGSIEDCDFSEAQLDGCRFHGCDMRTIKLPRWPCFTILDPIRRSQELMGKPWPGTVGPVTISMHATEPPSTVAVTWSASVLAKECRTTPEAIKAVLETCEGIFY